MHRGVVAVIAFSATLAACTLLTDFDQFDSADNQASADGSEDGATANDGGRDLADVIGSGDGAAASDATTRAPLGCGAADAGLVAYFRLDEGSGTQTHDCSGNDLVGNFPPDSGILWTTGVNGGALQLPDSFVSLGNPAQLQLTGAQEMTLSAFIQIGDVAATDRPAIVSKDGVDGMRGWELAITDEADGREAVVRISPDNMDEIELYSEPLALGTWVHVAATFKPGVFMRIYTDGKLSAALTQGVPLTVKDAPVPAIIGGRSYNYFWKGLLDDVRIYRRALADDEIADLAKR